MILNNSEDTDNHEDRVILSGNIALTEDLTILQEDLDFRPLPAPIPATAPAAGTQRSALLTISGNVTGNGQNLTITDIDTPGSHRRRQGREWSSPGISPT